MSRWECVGRRKRDMAVENEQPGSGQNGLPKTATTIEDKATERAGALRGNQRHPIYYSEQDSLLSHCARHRGSRPGHMSHSLRPQIIRPAQPTNNHLFTHPPLSLFPSYNLEPQTTITKQHSPTLLCMRRQHIVSQPSHRRTRCL